MRGPLDAWLVRMPSQNADVDNQAAVQEGSQPEEAGAKPDEAQAEGDAGREQAEPERLPRPGTLDAFLTRRDATQDASTSTSEQQEPMLRCRRLTRWLTDWQSTGRLHPRLAARLESSHVAQYSQRCMLQTHPWQQLVLGGRGSATPEQAGSLQAVQFDSQGELLVTGSEEGLLTVHSAAMLSAACGPPAAQPVPASHQGLSPAQPLLALDTGVSKLQGVRWNPANENVVGVASSATRQLLLFDLQHTQGRPTQVLSAPPQSSTSALGGSTAAGISDLAFFHSAGSSYLVLAGGLGGQVFLWDARAKAAPTAVLQSQQSSAVYAVALAADEQAVLAGTQSGEVKVWDLRGGRPAALRFGAVGLHHHPLLVAVNLRHALAAVPGLLEQTGVPASAVHSMALDPGNPQRLGFHLGCGWSGVLDLGSQAVTHVHAPSHAFADEHAMSTDDITVTQVLLGPASAAPALHRQACWAAGGSRFCVPSRRDDSLMLLDFSDSTAAGCYALSGDDTAAGGWQVPSAAHVPLTQPAVCAAAHPTADLLVAGGLGSCMSLMRLP